jgi:excisionase family DNA binding protein
MTNLSALSAKIDDLHELVLRANPPQWMTTQECAEYLKVSAERLYQMRKEGSGPPFFQPTERWVRYRLADVDAWMQGQQ